MAFAVTTAGPRCRHCRHYKKSRARGLCCRCSLDPEIRRLYPITSKFAPRRSEVRRANTLELVCDHCDDRHQRRYGEPLPPGWRRVLVDDYSKATATECPDCSVAWDLEMARRGG